MRRDDLAGLEHGFEGKPDLVVGLKNGAQAILDFKWDGQKDRRTELEAGTAHQLAGFSKLAANGAAPVGYFILKRKLLLSAQPESFPGCRPVNGPSVPETWDSLEAALKERRLEEKDGRLIAAGVPSADVEVPDEDAVALGVLRLKPGCNYCEFGGLCGVTRGAA